MALPVYTVDELVRVPADQVVAAVTASPVEPGDLEALLRHLGPIHIKDARFFRLRNSAADISKPHTSKWDPLADEVLEAA